MLYTEKSVLRYYVRFSQIRSHIYAVNSVYALHTNKTQIDYQQVDKYYTRMHTNTRARMHTYKTHTINQTHIQSTPPIP